MKGQRRGLYRVCLVVDAIIVIGSMFAALWIHGLLRSFLPGFREPPVFESYAALAYTTVPIVMGVSILLGLHRFIDHQWSYPRILWELLKVHIATLLSVAIVLFVTQSVINRSIVVLFLCTSLGLMFVERVIIRITMRYRYERGYGQPQILIVGHDTSAIAAFMAAAQTDDYAPHFVGYIAKSGALTHEKDVTLPYLGTMDRLENILHDHAVDRVFFLPPNNHPEEVLGALSVCETLGVSANFWMNIDTGTQAVPRMTVLYDRPFITYEVSPKSMEFLTVKHTMDALASFVLLLILAPLFLVVAVAILITMGRPVLFIQERSGLYGRRFRMFKFRTMEKNAEAKRSEVIAHNELDGPAFKMTRDPRVTRLGHFLRKTSIDEIPQLINVLLGTMSLVGPRPLPLIEQSEVRGWKRRRLSMRPGITGLWQVSGRSNISFEEWMKLDLQYVDQWSLGLDMRILCRTVPVVLFRKGAR